jgi:uncharacterized membrane protein YkvI
MDRTLAFTLLVIATVMLAGCELVGDIFKAGVWVGVILVILIVGLVVWLFARGRTWELPKQFNDLVRTLN